MIAATSDARRAHHERDERRRKPTQVEALERIDVTDHAAHEVAAPETGELSRCKRLDTREELDANPPEGAEGEVVRHEAFEVARERSRQREEADGDDRDGQREDGRLLGGPRDQVAGSRHERDPEPDRRGAEEHRAGEPPGRDPRDRDKSSKRGHAISWEGSRVRPSSSRTTLSARPASDGR